MIEYTKALIDGSWIAASSGAEFAVCNPASGASIAQVADLSAADAVRAVDAAHRAQPEWAKLSARDRAGMLKRWHQGILNAQDALAALITLEMGKPLTESRGEVAYGASFVEWFAEEAKRVYGQTIPAHQPSQRILVTKQPVGVVVAITPWNFPLAMITRKVSPALAAGCTVVVKPSEDTPLTALKLGQLALDAGFPPGVLNIVTGLDAPGIGQALIADTRVRKVTFTGSTAVGKILYRLSAATVKKLSLELGGNAPFIVMDDADIDAAVDGAMLSKFRNAGQTCVCANRILVQERVYAEFVARFTARVQALRVGAGDQPGVEIGPLINADGLAKVEAHLSDAIARGAQIEVGGERHPAGPLFFTPTVVSGVTPQMQMASEETFGPIAPIYRFTTESEALSLANDTPFGLAAYCYTRDLGRAFRMYEGLEYGIVGMNTGIISTEVAPFGGVKESGLGREGGPHGIDEFLEVKYGCFDLGSPGGMA
jgi:succinate-semialdehyde dehydrogenase/glutarate-semialdehyde dehydrogenase